MKTRQENTHKKTLAEKLKEVEETHKKEIEKVKREESLREQFPTDIQPRWVHDHGDHFSIKYERTYPENGFTMQEAFTLIDQWKDFIIISEHWKDSCVSCRPSALQKTKKNAVLDGQSFVELQTSLGKGYSTTTFTFWAEIFGHIVDVDIVINMPWKYRPTVHDVKWQGGDFISQRIDCPHIGEDSRRSWWHSGYGYKRSFYWADEYNFDAWVSHHLAMELKNREGNQ